MNPSLDIASTVTRVTDTIKLRCTLEQSHPGGGGINVSRIIHNLCGDSIAVFPCGGYTGDRLMELLKQEDLTTHPFPIQTNTRQSFSIHETSTGKDFRFLLPGQPLSPEIADACLQYIRDLKDKPHFIVASGSLPPGLSDNFYAELGKLASTVGAKFVLDTSGPALAHALEAGGIYLIKPSLDELEELSGESLASEALQISVARNLIRSGKAEVLALSLGAKGALLITADFALRAQGLEVTPVSSVGAGDSMLGAMIWALERRLSLELAFRYGIAAATSTILNMHGGMGQLSQIEKFLDQIQITAI